MIWYLAICQDCEPRLPQPFSDPREMADWVVGHKGKTGHTVLLKVEPK